MQLVNPLASLPQRLFDFLFFFLWGWQTSFLLTQHSHFLFYLRWTVDASASYLRRIMLALQGVIGCLRPTKLFLKLPRPLLPGTLDQMLSTRFIMHIRSGSGAHKKHLNRAGKTWSTTGRILPPFWWAASRSVKLQRDTSTIKEW